jgi:hypothetical protein
LPLIRKIPRFYSPNPLVPDQGTAYQFGDVIVGETTDLEREAEYLFNRMVMRQYHRPVEERRTDEDVWRIYQAPLRDLDVAKNLLPHVVRTDDFKLEFDYAFRNGAWNILQPLSLDLSTSEAVLRKAARWLGNVTAVQDSPDLGKMIFLLGMPTDPDLRKASQQAQNILDRVPVPHEFVDEAEAEPFAKEVATIVQSHSEDADN